MDEKLRNLLSGLTAAGLIMAGSLPAMAADINNEGALKTATDQLQQGGAGANNGKTLNKSQTILQENLGR
jgi:hypothetical protein